MKFDLIKTYRVTKATRERMVEVARVFKKSFQTTYPDFPVLHSVEEDAAHFSREVFEKDHVYIAENTESGEVIGFIAYNGDFIDHLYLLPEAQGRGIGADLLELSKAESKTLRLWTFQANTRARAFYAKHGFTEVLKTDGTENEEKQPDVLLEWNIPAVLRVRAENSSDTLRISEIHDLAFNAKGEAKLVELIRGSEAFIPALSFVAEQKGQIVGHVLFSKISLIENKKDLLALSLAPVGVLPEFQNRGIGTKLIEAGIQKARELGFRSILVLGDPAYYKRFGFRHELVSKIECRYNCKAFAGLELTDRSLSSIQTASADYPDAFKVVDEPI